MLSKISLLLALVAPLVSGLTLQIPTAPTSGGQVTLNWTNDAGDAATFSIELVNEVFHNSFAIANNVQPELTTLTLNLPIVPAGAGYTLEAVNIGNITQVYASTGSFSIGATVTSAISSSSLASASNAASSTAPVATRSATSTSAFGVTATSSQRSASQSASSAAASPSSAAVPTLKMYTNVGGLAAVLLSVVARAAIVAF